MYNYACVLAFVDIVRAGSPVTVPPGPRVAASGAIAMLAACCVHLRMLIAACCMLPAMLAAYQACLPLFLTLCAQGVL